MAKSAKTQPAATQAVYQMLPVSDLTGGLDVRQDKTLLASDRAQRLINWSLSSPGALTVRAGFRTFASFSSAVSTLASGGPAQGGARVYLHTNLPSLNSTAFTLIANSGFAWLITDSGAVLSLAGLFLSSASIVSFPYDHNLVVAMDGTSTLLFKSTNGSSWTRFGIANTGTAATLNSTSGGALTSNAEYEVSYTYKDRDLAFESNGHTGSTITLSSANSTQAIRVVVPNSADAQVDAIVAYARNKTSGETVLRKASSQAISAGANSTLLITSSNWTSNDEIPTDHDLPPELAFGVVWKNRWWARHGTNGGRLHFTQLFQPQSWPSLFYIDIPFDRGDVIRSLDAIGDTLIVHGATKAFVILGQTSLDFEVRPALGSQAGSLGPRATARVESSLIHADATGVYSFDGATDRLISRDLEPAWRDLVQNAPVSALERVSMTYDSLRKEVRIAVPRKQPSTGVGEWVLDLNRSEQQQGALAWTETDRSIAGYISWDGPESVAGNRGRLFGWSATLPTLYEEAVGTTADGADMVASYEGPGLTLGARQGRWVDMRGEYEPNAGRFSVEGVVDGVPQGPRTINIGAGLATYDTSLYDTATYAGAGRRQWYSPFPLTSEGRTLVQQLIYTGQAAFKHFGYAIGLVPEPQARDFSE